MKWEMDSKISEAGEICAKIRREMPRPVGILIVGAGLDREDDFKQRVLETLRSGLQGLAQRSYGGMPNMSELRAAVKSYSSEPPEGVDVYTDVCKHAVAIFTLTAERSASRALRHDAVSILRRCGAETIVLIYARCKEPKVPILGGILPRYSDDRRLRRLIQTMEANPPTAEGVEYFITVSEE